MALFDFFKKTPEDWFQEAQRTRRGVDKSLAEAMIRDAEQVAAGLSPQHEWPKRMEQVHKRVAHCLEKALQIDSSFAPAWLAKGEQMLYSTKTHLDEAIACLDKALAVNPMLADAHCLKARALELKGACDEALACYERAIEYNPRDGEAWLWKSRLLARQGNAEQARVCEEKANSVDPSVRHAPAWRVRWLELRT